MSIQELSANEQKFIVDNTKNKFFNEITYLAKEFSSHRIQLFIAYLKDFEILKNGTDDSPEDVYIGFVNKLTEALTRKIKYLNEEITYLQEALK